jgi:hypothetical protein
MVSYCLASGIRFNDYLFSEPVPLEGWTAPQFAGVYVLLAPDPNWAPKGFQPLYFGEFGNATPASVFFEAAGGLVDGAARNVFVAILAMPFSTTTQRLTVCRELVAAYHPTHQGGAPGPQSHVTFQMPRRRIGFLPDTETA